MFAQKVRSLLGISYEWYKDTRTVEESFSLIRTVITTSFSLIAKFQLFINAVCGTNISAATALQSVSVLLTFFPVLYRSLNKLFSPIHM